MGNGCEAWKRSAVTRGSNPAHRLTEEKIIDQIGSRHLVYFPFKDSQPVLEVIIIGFNEFVKLIITFIEVFETFLKKSDTSIYLAFCVASVQP